MPVQSRGAGCSLDLHHLNTVVPSLLSAPACKAALVECSMSNPSGARSEVSFHPTPIEVRVSLFSISKISL